MTTILTVAALYATTSAHAVEIGEPHKGARPTTFEVHGGFGFYGLGPAGGVRFGIPLVDNGFIAPINNAVYLSVGADVYTITPIANVRDSGIGVGVPVALHWGFYFTDEWSAFAEAGANIYLDTNTFSDSAWAVPFANWYVSAVGGRYHLSDSMALVARLGTPYAAIGVEWEM